MTAADGRFWWDNSKLLIVVDFPNWENLITKIVFFPLLNNDLNKAKNRTNTIENTNAVEWGFRMFFYISEFKCDFSVYDFPIIYSNRTKLSFERSTFNKLFVEQSDLTKWFNLNY